MRSAALQHAQCQPRTTAARPLLPGPAGAAASRQTPARGGRATAQQRAASATDVPWAGSVGKQQQQPPPSSKGSTITREAREALFAKAVDREEVEAEVTGAIPAWLEGALIANGGGDYQGMKHLFDGLAMLTKLRVAGGRVWASQRYLGSEQYKSVAQTGKRKWAEFATQVPTASPLEQAQSILSTLVGLVTHDGFTDNGSVNAVPLGNGQLLATSETVTSMYRVDAGSLQTLGQAKVQGDGIPGDLITAHPKLLRDGRTLVNFSRSIPAGGFHVFTQDTRTLERKQIAFIRDLDPTAPAWVHDMAFTGNHIVICETPLFFNLASLVTGAPTEFQFMDWKPERGSRIHVVPLDGSAHKTFLTAPFFTFHQANGFEADGQIHVDLAYYDDPQSVNDLSMSSIMAYPGAEYSKSQLRRLSIPMAAPTGATIPAPRTLSPAPEQYGDLCDFPTVNPNWRGRAHRYVYALGAVRPTNIGNGIAKHDTVGGGAQLWHEAGGATGECVFVPRPGGTEEEDGVVLVQHMGADGRSSLVVLDAASWVEVGRARLPYGLPYRFHGSFHPAPSMLQASS